MANAVVYYPRDANVAHFNDSSIRMLAHDRALKSKELSTVAAAVAEACKTLSKDNRVEASVQGDSLDMKVTVEGAQGFTVTLSPPGDAKKAVASGKGLFLVQYIVARVGLLVSDRLDNPDAADGGDVQGASASINSVVAKLDAMPEAKVGAAEPVVKDVVAKLAQVLNNIGPTSAEVGGTSLTWSAQPGLPEGLTIDLAKVHATVLHEAAFVYAYRCGAMKAPSGGLSINHAADLYAIMRGISNGAVKKPNATSQTTQGQANSGPNTRGQANSGPNTRGQTNGGPNTRGQTNGGPNTRGQATGGPSTQGQATGGPSTRGQTNGGPNTRGQANGGPSTQGQTNGGPNTRGQTNGGPITDGHITDGLSIKLLPPHLEVRAKYMFSEDEGSLQGLEKYP